MKTTDLPLVKPAKPIDHNLLNILGIELNSSFPKINKSYIKRKEELEILAKTDMVKQKELDFLNEAYDNFNNDYQSNLKKIRDIKESLDILDSDPYCSFKDVEEQYKKLNNEGDNQKAAHAFEVLSENKHFLSPVSGKRGGLLFGLSILGVAGISLAAISATRGSDINSTDMFAFDPLDYENISDVTKIDVTEISNKELIEDIHREIIVDIIEDENSFNLLFSGIELGSKLSALNILIKGI